MKERILSSRFSYLIEDQINKPSVEHEITYKSYQSLPDDFLIRYSHDMQGWIPSEVEKKL